MDNDLLLQLRGFLRQAGFAAQVRDGDGGCRDCPGECGECRTGDLARGDYLFDRMREDGF